MYITADTYIYAHNNTILEIFKYFPIYNNLVMLNIFTYKRVYIYPRQFKNRKNAI